MPDAFAQLEDQDIDSRVVLDFTSRDFTAIRAQLVGLARGLFPEWETAGEPSDFGTLLLELWAYMADVMHFYIDRTASEAFLGTALRQQSVLYIADMLGYTPVGQQAASVTLNFTLDPNASEKVTLPVRTLISNTTDNADNLIVFELQNEIVIDPNGPIIPPATTPVLTATGYATEGVTDFDRMIGVSLGSPNTEFVLPNTGVIYNSVSVSSREGFQVVQWSYTNHLASARPTQPVFTTYLDDQNFTHIIFGDNVSGRIPPNNAEIFVTYRYGKGAAANELATDSVKAITNPGTPGTDDWWAVKVTNPEPPVGGTNPESVDAMRQSIPRAAARIKNRAITLHDYADLALQVPGVSKSVAFGTVYTAVRVRIAPVGGVANDDYLRRLCEQVTYYMQDKVIIGSTVYVEPDTIDLLWHTLTLRLMVHAQAGYNRTSVRIEVDRVVRQVLLFDNVDFGTRISIGQVYRSALAVQGVEWVELQWLNELAPLSVAIEKDIESDDDQRQIHDIVPDTLHIPKIDPTKKTELETDWPTLTEDERTHDGLWVKAVGGLPGT